MMRQSANQCKSTDLPIARSADQDKNKIKKQTANQKQLIFMVLSLIGIFIMIWDIHLFYSITFS